jgi:hypothetical protein
MENAIISNKLQKFGEVTPKAYLYQTMKALTTLTDVEFRMWLNACEKYGSFDPSHFEGKEKHFIETGSWNLNNSEQIK